MTLMTKRLPSYTLPLVLLLLPLTGRADTTVKRLAPGVTLTQEIDKTTPLVINVLSIDLDAPGVRLGVGVGQDRVSGTDATRGREDVSRYARRHRVLAAVNADFFPYTGDPLGVGIKDGELFSEPYTGSAKGGPRVTFGVTPGGRGVVFDTLTFLGDLQAQDGQRAFLNGVNRVPSAGEIVAFTSLYGPLSANRKGGTDVVVVGANLPVRANKLMVGRVQQVLTGAQTATAIPPRGLVISGAPGAGADFLAQHVHPGDKIGFVLAIAPVGSVASGVQIAGLPRTEGDLPSRAGQNINRAAFLWAQIPQALGGGPRLLTNGLVAVTGVAEGFDAGFVGSAHPRTAVGTSRDGRRLFVVTVDGRQTISKGVSLNDLALILKRYGVWNAINFDGGGSTAMAVGGLLVNSPEGTGEERPVADMLVIDSDRPDLTLPRVSPTPPAGGPQLLIPLGPVPIGQATPLRIADGERTLSGSDGRILWQGMVTGGVGFVNQKGYFIPLKPGTGTVTALYKGRFLTGRVTVQAPAPPVALFAVQGAFTPDPAGASNRGELTVRILDQTGKPFAGAPVHLSVTGGAADATDARTNADGYVTVGVTWQSSQGGSVIIQSGTLKAVTVLQPNSTP